MRFDAVAGGVAAGEIVPCQVQVDVASKYRRRALGPPVCTLETSQSDILPSCLYSDVIPRRFILSCRVITPYSVIGQRNFTTSCIFNSSCCGVMASTSCPLPSCLCTDITHGTF